MAKPEASSAPASPIPVADAAPREVSPPEPASGEAAPMDITLSMLTDAVRDAFKSKIRGSDAIATLADTIPEGHPMKAPLAAFAFDVNTGRAGEDIKRRVNGMQPDVLAKCAFDACGEAADGEIAQWLRDKFPAPRPKWLEG